MDEERVTQYKDTEITIDIVGILLDIIRGWWLVAMAAIVAVLGSYMVTTASYTPVYSTSATLLVTTRTGVSSANYNISAAYQMAEIFQRITESDILKRRVMEELETNSVPGTITTELISQSNMMRVKVEANSPQDAFLIMKSVLKNAPDIASYIQGSPSIEVMDPPYLPSQPSNQVDIQGVIERAGKIGALAAMAALAVLSYLKDTVKTESDITNKINTTLLGTVYKEKKKGLEWFGKKQKGLVLSKFTISFNFVESIKKIRNRVEYAAKMNQGKIIMVTSVMENEGKTTMTANLALALAEKGRKVLLVDGDLRKPALHKILEQPVEENQQFGYVLKKKLTVNEALIHNKTNHLLMLLGTKSFEKSSEMVSGGRFEDIIKKASEQVDYVIIDSPPLAYLSDAEAMITCADGVILTVRQDKSTITQIKDALDGLSQGNAKVYGCIFNQVRRYGSYGTGHGNHYSYSRGYDHYKKRGQRSNESISQ